MKHSKLTKIAGIALISMLSLTSCANDFLAPPTEKTAPTKSSAEPSEEAEPTEEDGSKSEEFETPENEYEASTYTTLKDVDVDLLLEEYVDPEVPLVFPAKQHSIESGVEFGLDFLETANTYEGFFEKRKHGEDLNFLLQKEIKGKINKEAFEALSRSIKQTGRVAFLPATNLNGEMVTDTVRMKADGVPTSYYDMPVVTVGKSSKNLDRLMIQGYRTLFYKGAEGSYDLKQTVQYYLFLSPDGKNWKVSGMGYHHLYPPVKVSISEGTKV